MTKSQEGLHWSPQAEQALEQAVDQVPGPKLLAKQVSKKLRERAETITRESGRSEVAAEDLIQGLMEMLPKNVQEMIKKRMDEGPEGMKKLEDDLKGMG